MIKQNYKFALTLLALLLLVTFLFGPVFYARYTESQNGNAYHIKFPVMTLAQEKTIGAFLDILSGIDAAEDTPEKKAFDTLIGTMENGGLGNSLYITADDLPNNSGNQYIQDLYDSGTECECIIKFNKNGNEVDVSTFTIFTITTNSNLTNNMYNQVFKTVVNYDPTSDTYTEKFTYEGYALRAVYGGDYNTDYWARKLDEGETYSIDLNLETDKDVSTNYDDQGTSQYGGRFTSAVDGCTFIAFTPEETGEYIINVDKSCRIRGRTSNLNYMSNNNWTNPSVTTITADGDIGTYTTATLAAGTTYYYCFQMPTGSADDQSYIINISISKN